MPNPGYATSGNWGVSDGGLLNGIIGGGRALSGWGDYIAQAAARANVPLSLITTLLAHESAFGSWNDGLTPYNNFTGLTTPSSGWWPGQIGVTEGFARDFAIFDSIESGINAALENLLIGYQGLSLRQVLSLWLTGDPFGASDPEGYTTADYLNHAAEIISMLGGDFNPDVLMFAHGGVVTKPTLGLIGEDAGTTPEIISPVALMKQTVREALAETGARAGGTYTINNHGRAWGPREFFREMEHRKWLDRRD